MRHLKKLLSEQDNKVRKRRRKIFDKFFIIIGYNYDFDNLFSNKDIIHNKFFSANSRLLNIISMFVFQVEEDDESNNDGNVNSSFAKQLSNLLKQKNYL